MSSGPEVTSHHPDLRSNMFHVISVIYGERDTNSMNDVTVSRRGDRLVAVKRARADDAERLRREAEILGRLEHPGVVRVVEFRDDDPVELVFEYTGTDSWQRRPPSTGATIIDGLATISATIGALHDAGTAHRALSPDHVLVSSTRRPVLCGFADAGEADEPNRTEDLAGLAGLITHLRPGAPTELGEELDRLAAAARTGSLTAHDLATRLRGLRAPEPGNRRLPRPNLRRAAAPAVVVLVVAAIAGLGMARSGPTAAPPPDRDPLAAARPPIPDPSAPRGTTPESSAPQAPDAPPPPSAPVAADPLVLVHDGRRFGVGRVGDIAIVGDWNCDGTATPALLETRLDRVSIFPEWPEPDTSLTATATMRVAGATDLQRIEVDGCDRLRVVHPRGSTLFTPELP